MTNIEPVWQTPPATPVDKDALIQAAIDGWSVISFGAKEIKESWVHKDHLVLVLKDTWHFGGCWMPEVNAVLIGERLWNAFDDDAKQILVEHERIERTNIVEAHPDKRVGLDISHSKVVGNWHAITNNELVETFGREMMINYAENGYHHHLATEDDSEVDARESALYTILGSGLTEADVFGDTQLDDGWWEEYNLRWPDGQKPSLHE